MFSAVFWRSAEPARELPERQREELSKAVSKYEAELEKADGQLLEELNKAVKNFREQTVVKGEAKRVQLDDLETARKAFLDEYILPFSPSMRPHLKRYLDAVRPPLQMAVSAYESAIECCNRSPDPADAKLARELVDKKRAILKRVVAAWDCSGKLKKGKVHKWTFFLLIDGTVTVDPDDKSERTWEFESASLKIKARNAPTITGEITDICPIGENGFTLTGSNEHDFNFTGTLKIKQQH